MITDEYWASFEGVIDSLEGYLSAAEKIGAYQNATDSQFVWRGVSSSSWGLHSSLVRAYSQKAGTIPTERLLRGFERALLEEARAWSMDWLPAGGRLSALEMMARLQHYGIPTRLIDFTYSPLVALWFAVNGPSKGDGRVFAVDVSGHLISRDEAVSDDPWWWDQSA